MDQFNFMPNTSNRREGVNIKEFNKYGMDQTGTVKYVYNSLNYRGEEFDPNAKKLIYIVGCSHTHGTGLQYGDTYGHQFKKAYAKRFNLHEDEVNLMNFSVGGASNSYMVRTLITNCNVKKPDVLICNFSHKKIKSLRKKVEINLSALQLKELILIY